MDFKKHIRPTYYRLSHLYRRSMLNLGRILLSPRSISTKVTFSYAPGVKLDGLGAQLQRVLAINALGEYWSVEVKHDPIAEIAIHPLDEINNSNDYLVFMNNVNRVIGSHESTPRCERSFYFSNFNFSQLMKVLLYVYANQKSARINLTLPYYFVDSKPEIYNCKSNFLVRKRLNSFSTLNLSDQIVLHHRQGVGNMAIQPGQKLPREIAQQFYLRVLSKCIDFYPGRTLTVFTDAPISQMEFRPPSNQIESWVDLPSFDGNKMTIAANSLDWITEQLSLKTKVIRGGNPLETMANMSTAKVLILSRSSFGYLAAILAEMADVWIPSDFWHQPLPGWRKYPAI